MSLSTRFNGLLTQMADLARAVSAHRPTVTPAPVMPTPITPAAAAALPPTGIPMNRIYKVGFLVLVALFFLTMFAPDKTSNFMLHLGQGGRSFLALTFDRLKHMAEGTTEIPPEEETETNPGRTIPQRECRPGVDINCVVPPPRGPAPKQSNLQEGKQRPQRLVQAIPTQRATQTVDRFDEILSAITLQGTNLEGKIESTKTDLTTQFQTALLGLERDSKGLVTSLEETFNRRLGDFNNTLATVQGDTQTAARRVERVAKSLEKLEGSVITLRADLDEANKAKVVKVNPKVREGEPPEVNLPADWETLNAATQAAFLISSCVDKTGLRNEQGVINAIKRHRGGRLNKEAGEKVLKTCEPSDLEPVSANALAQGRGIPSTVGQASAGGCGGREDYYKVPGMEVCMPLKR